MKLKEHIKNLFKKLPFAKAHFEKHAALLQESAAYWENAGFPPGHFYSPIISVKDIRSREDQIWKKEPVTGMGGIDLNTEAQLQLMNQFADYYPEMPFEDKPSGNRRFYFVNDYYSYTEGIVLYSMIRHFQPKNIIEIGSGFTSAAMLDTNELFYSGSINLTFIEPYPERLHSLLTDQDRTKTTILETGVQSVPLDVFEQLNANDILFVDSTHVVKTGSDVNYIVFEILPRLKSGVLIHFHDLFYPFEYPKEWVFKGMNWNEDYFIRAFLMYNSQFTIRLFTDYLRQHHREAFAKMPLCTRNYGSSLWLQKQ